MRIGHGYDVHRFCDGEFVTLGGVQIAHKFGLLAHSDGDVLLHALSDALLGAAALGDIGKHFPDTDPQFKGADSRVLLRHVLGLVKAKGWQVDRVVREETGVLPVVMGGDLDNYWASGSGRTAKAGARGAFFHPVTSYSLPDAVRNAIFIAEQPDLDGVKLNMLMRQRADAHWKSGKFYRMLNRMMFRASMPNERYKVLERFYTLKPGLIERFYSGSTTGGDKARILSGKPPVPVGKAIRALRPRTKKR